MDLHIMQLEKEGKLVPTRDMVKTPEQIEGIRIAGRVNTGCLDAVAREIHEGMSTQEIDDICMQYCREHNAVPACLNYCTIGDIGHVIQVHAEKYGYGVVRDLCGHGVGLAMHEEPDILHYGRPGTGMVLVPGMVFTIEPMINMGTWKVFIDSDDPYGWEVISGDEKPSAQWEHTFLMTETGVEILSY